MPEKTLKRAVFVSLMIVQGMCFDNVVKSSCSADVKSCEFHWSIGYFHTMTVIPPNGKGSRLPIIPINGTLYARTNCGSLDHIRKLNDKDKYVTGDGTPKMIYAINDQVPGPSIVVYEGQEIVVHVHNNLLMEGVSIHWHGLLQKETPFMDGIARVTQCPINPGETFTYRFKATPHGTYWYHSHLGVQRSDGLAGALIISKRPQLHVPKLTEDIEIKTEFVLMVEDLFRTGYTHEVKMAQWDMNKFATDPSKETCADIKKTYDNSLMGQKGRQAPVINARGRFLNPYLKEDHTYLPLETFVVKRHQAVVFRIIGIQAMSSYRISFDNHKLKVIATDGSDIDPVEVDFVILHAGERYDVEITTDEPVSNYWIRLEDLTNHDIQGNSIPMTRGFGIIRYEGAKPEDPSSFGKKCSEKQPCQVLNCLFGMFPASQNTHCIPVSDLKASQYEIQNNPVPIASQKEDIQEIFLNFHYSVEEDNPGIPVSTINNLRMVLPASPPLIDNVTPFPEFVCPSEVSNFASKCTHVLKLELGKVIQIVLHNHETHGFGRGHPVHMHGHKYHVMKMVFPEYDPMTGTMIKMSQDIACDTPNCDSAKWADPSWEYGNVPGLNFHNPVLKDTLILPWGGYAVIRILADNPGFWYMHCHIELHNLDGMALIIQEGERSDMLLPPNDMKSCGNANNLKAMNASLATTKNFKLLQQTNEKGLTTEPGVSATSVIGSAILTTLVAISLVINVVSAIIMFKRRGLYTYFHSSPGNSSQSFKSSNDESRKLLG